MWMNRSAHRAHLATMAALVLCVASVAMAAAGTVNVNTADADQLMLLPRIGPSVARRIIEFREENGKFEQVTDLLLVKGIGEKTFELLEPYVTVTGDTSLEEKVKVARGGDAPDRG